MDVNDNKPIFLYPRGGNTSLKLYIGNLHAGSVITQIIAVDYDKGENSKINYRLVNNPSETNDSMVDRLFYIDQESGLILLKMNITAEHLGLYKLLIEATDNGYPNRMFDLAVLTIHLTDEARDSYIYGEIQKSSENVYLMENPTFLVLLLTISSVSTLFCAFSIYCAFKMRPLLFNSRDNSLSEFSRKSSPRNEYAIVPATELQTIRSSTNGQANPLENYLLLNIENENRNSTQREGKLETRESSFDSNSCCANEEINEPERNISIESHIYENCQGRCNTSNSRTNNQNEQTNQCAGRIQGAAPALISHACNVHNSPRCQSERPIECEEQANRMNFHNLVHSITRSLSSSLNSINSHSDVARSDNASLNDAKSYMPTRVRRHIRITSSVPARV